MSHVVITGAGGNLGREVVRYFLEQGFRVTATVRDAAEASGLRRELESRGSYESKEDLLEVTELELTDEEAVRGFAGGTGRRQPVDAVFMLAGGFAMGGVKNTDLEAIRKQLSVNFETAYPLARAFFGHMKERGRGRLVFVGTRPALEPAAGKDMVAYALAKSLLFRLSEMLNEAARGTDVVSSVIVPSTIDTPANRQSMPDADFDKWVKPAQIAALLHMVCSDTGAPLRETVLKIYHRA